MGSTKTWTDQDLFAEDQDTLRVYLVDADGVNHLLATNNEARGQFDNDDEFDDPTPVANGVYNDNVDVKVQQLYDNTGTWRQARVDLGDFAGQRNLTLRVEFSSAGTTLSSSDSLRTVNPDQLVNGAAFFVNGERFEIDLAPSISLPPGSLLKTLYDTQSGRRVIHT